MDSYLTEHTLENPTVEQLRCAAQIVSRNGRTVRVLYSASVASEVLKPELPPFQATWIS